MSPHIVSSRPGAGRARRLAALVTLSVVAMQAVAVDADAAALRLTDLTSESFTGAKTADSGWVLPSADSNGACLTAGTDTAQSPIPACDTTAIDAGSGTLRLTTNALSAVGTVYNTTSLPTSQGLDVRFNSYQWNSHTYPGADGTSFILAATDPTSPAPPASTGPIGGSLGYSAAKPNDWFPGATGVTNGYLGFGLDVFGNYRNSAFGGTGCPDTDPAPQNVTVRGPGNGLAGYCIAGTQQVTAGALDDRDAVERPASVPVEIALNPASSETTSLGGVTVPAASWLIAYTPLGGSQQVLTGSLPSASTLRDYGYPASYYDPITGLPYQLTFGWAASTGGNDEIHEISTLTSSTLNGQLPDFNLAVTDDQAATLLAGSAATISVSPSLEASQGPETRPATVTTTLPDGLTPSNPASSDYTCSTSDQVVRCTYTPSSAIAPGQSLPTLKIPVRVATSAASKLTITSKVSSTDANPAEATRDVSIVDFEAHAPAHVTYGTAATLSATGLPGDATGTITFTSAGSTLCTATLPSGSCTTSPTLAPGSYPITATYSGDATYATQMASTSLEVGQATPELSAAVSDDQVSYGTPDVLSFSGLPKAATGSVTFTSGDTTLCEVADVTAASSCTTRDDLEVGPYEVVATYSGDANFDGATAGTSFSVAKAAVDLHAAVDQADVPYGTAETLSVAGLPDGASGTVVFRTSDGTELCTIDDVATATSCQTAADLDLGTYAVTATYSGDDHHLKDQATTSFSVGQAGTALVASVSDPSVPFGTSSTLSFSGLPADATGTVVFTTGSRTLCTLDVAKDSSCSSPTDLPSGDHVVVASYSGDDHYQPSQDSTGLTVTPEGSPTFTASASDPAPLYGTADTLAFSGLADGATGSVTFTADGRELCRVADVTESNSCTTRADLDAGDYDVIASYSGDHDHASASAPAHFSVAKVGTTLHAAAAVDVVTDGSAQTLSFGGLPQGVTGSVTFTDDSGDVLCRVADVREASGCSTSTDLASGGHTVTAVYSGDRNHDGSTTQTHFRVDKAPTAKDLTVRTGFNTAVPVTLSGDDPDSDAVRFTVQDEPAHGTLSGSAPDLTYTPDEDYSGSDSFTYTAKDGTSESRPATVSVTVAAKPDTAPTAKDLAVETEFGTATPITLAGDDPDGDALTFAVADGPQHGTLSGASPNLVYTPQKDFSGKDSFTYTANDGTTDSEPATVSVTVDAATPEPTPVTPSKEFVVDRNGLHHSRSVTSKEVKVRKVDELLLAFVSVNGPAGKAQSITKVTGGGLTWSLAARGNEGLGTSEVWRAYATHTQKGFKVKASFARTGYSSKITVAGFTHASPVTGATATASAKRSAPSVTLTPRATGSLVWAAGRVVGERYDPRPGQGTRIVHDVGISHPRVGYWVQKASTPTTAGQPVTIFDNIATSNPWGMTAVEIRGAAS